MLLSVALNLRTLALLLVLHVASATVGRTQLPSGTWQYYWGDDFGGDAVDTTKWDVASPSWGMSGMAPTASSPSKVHVGDGVLTLEATRTKVNGSNASGDENFTGGMISTYTKPRFNGGYIEARILLPDTVGSWPAFWGLFDGWPPEMDIMEYPLGAYANTEYHTAFHYSTGSGNSAGAGKVNPGSAGDLRGNYHTFGAKWVEDQSVQFYFDGNEVSSFYNASAVAQMQNMYLILNYAVGGWPATPSTTDWPVGFTDETKVDWVRVWNTADAKSSNWAYSGTDEYVQWDAAGNWTNGSPNLGGVTSSFGTVNAAEQRIDWSGRRTLSVVNLDGDTRYRLGFSDDRLVLAYGNGGTIAPTINIAASTTVEHEVQATLEFAGGLNVNNNSGHALLLSGPVIGGGGNVRVAGTGPVSFDEVNSYTADTLVGVGQGAAVARARSAGPFGIGGTVVIGESGNATTARLELESGANVPNSIAMRGRNNATAAIVNNSGENTISGTVNIEVGGATYLVRSDAGTLTLSGKADPGGVAVRANNAGGNRTLSLGGAGNGVVSGVIENGSAATLEVAKSDNGTWTFDAQNTYTGATTVSAGMLSVNGATGLGNTTVAGGGTLMGRGTVRGNLIAQPGSAIRAGGELPYIQNEILLDDFSGDLSPYTDVRILDNNGGGSNAYVWEIADGALQINTSSYDGIEQSTLTRNDVTLEVGKEIRADYRHDQTSAQDIGLYAGAGTPAANVRSDFVNIYMRNDGVLYSRGFNGTTELGLVSGGAVDPDSLFIARTGTNTFELGYYNGESRVVLATRTMSNTTIGSALGFYSDVRAAGTRGSLDNLWLLDPDNSQAQAETLTVGGDFSLSTGASLLIDIAPYGADTVDIAGTATLDGELWVELDAGYAPEMDETFTVLTAQGVSNNLTLSGPDGDKFTFSGSTATELVLTFVGGLAGDYNDDGVVNVADYTVWRDNLGAAAGTLPNDNSGGPIGSKQYNSWASNFGATPNSESQASQSVPEPSAGCLFAAFIGCLCFRRK